jgi:hypothetical protein
MLTHRPFYHHRLPVSVFLKQARPNQATAPSAIRQTIYNDHLGEMASHAVARKRRTMQNRLQAGILQNNL